MYELFLVYQQRALNWKNSGNKSEADVRAALNVRSLVFSTAFPALTTKFDRKYI